MAEIIEEFMPAITRIAGQILAFLRKDMKESTIIAVFTLCCTLGSFIYTWYSSSSFHKIDVIFQLYHCSRIYFLIVKMYFKWKFWKMLTANQQRANGRQLVRITREASRSGLIKDYALIEIFRYLSFFVSIVLFFIYREVFKTANISLIYLTLLKVALFLYKLQTRLIWSLKFKQNVYNMKVGPKQYIIESNSSVIPFTELSSRSRYVSETCSICMDDYEDKCEIRVLHCEHHFHMKCIDIWLNNKGSCPFCLIPINRRRV